jgi:4-diphosphocytidyl-2-C-methyl-D-erythritol kinase
VPTACAYSRWQDAREIPGVTYSLQDFQGASFINDLERSVFEKFVFLADLKMWLLKQPEVGAALLSGSGSALFAVLRRPADADVLEARVVREVDPELWTFKCETC